MKKAVLRGHLKGWVFFHSDLWALRETTFNKRSSTPGIVHVVRMFLDLFLHRYRDKRLPRFRKNQNRIQIDRLPSRARVFADIYLLYRLPWLIARHPLPSDATGFGVCGGGGLICVTSGEFLGIQ